MDENKLLAALAQSRRAWERARDFISSNDFSAAGMRLLSEFDRFYNEDAEADKVDPEIIEGRLLASIPSKVQKEAMTSLLDDLYSLDISPASVATYALEVKRRKVGLEVSQLLIKNEAREVIRDKLEELTTLIEAESTENVHDVEERPDVRALMEVRSVGNRLPIAPGALNSRLKGGALPGHHIVVFARPEIGKSLFCINMAAVLVRRGYRVLWVENEDPIEDIWPRFYSRLTGVPEEIMSTDPDKYEQQLMESGIDNLYIYEAFPGSIFEIKKKIEEIQPDMVIVNQIRNLDVNSEGRVNQLEMAAQGVRNLSKEYDIVGVSVTQAGDSAENKLYLGMGDIDYSNTGIPSTADLLIGIGADVEMKMRGSRTISLPKNKISGKHDSFPVYFDTQISKVKSEGK